MSSAISFNLDQSKILSSGNDLKASGKSFNTFKPTQSVQATMGQNCLLHAHLLHDKGPFCLKTQWAITLMICSECCFSNHV